MTVITLPGVLHRSTDFELDPEVLAGLWRMEDAHFWHASRNRWLLQVLATADVPKGASVLDVGCGGGSVASALAQRGYRVTGIDTAEVLVRKANERVPGATFIAGSVGDLPSTYGPFDVVTICDVLEHLDAPLPFLTSALRLARPGALVVITVPAMRSLCTVIDELSGHKKRYEPGELAGLLGEAGLACIEERAIFRAIWPILLLSRLGARGRSFVGVDADTRRRILLADARIPVSPVNRLLGFLCDAERRLGFRASQGKSGPTLLATGRVAAVVNGE